MFPRETFFLARAYPSVRPSVFRRWVFFLFATDLATKMGVTDNWYTDERVPSVRPSVIISPTDFIPVTDGISPSVKLFNGVVVFSFQKIHWKSPYFYFFLLKKYYLTRTSKIVSLCYHKIKKDNIITNARLRLSITFCCDLNN